MTEETPSYIPSEHHTHESTSKRALVPGATYLNSELICISSDVPDQELLGLAFNDWVGESLFRFTDSDEKSFLLSIIKEAELDGWSSGTLEGSQVLVQKDESGYKLLTRPIANGFSESLSNVHSQLFEECQLPIYLFDEKGRCTDKNKVAQQVDENIGRLEDMFNEWTPTQSISLEKLWKDIKEGERCQYVALQDKKGQEWMAEIAFLQKAKSFSVRLHTDLGSFSKVESDVHIQTIAHDLRAPLANLQNILTLQDRLNDEEKQRELQTNAHKSVKRLQTLLNNLLVVANDEETEEKKIHLKELWNVVLEDLDFLISEAQPRLAAQFDVEYSLIDGALLRSIFQNLLSNSLKYRSPDRPCRIALEVYSNQLGLTIRLEDNGLGMDLTNGDEELFARFTTVGNDGSKGTGLGLSLLKEKVNQLNGQIQVRSQLDRGSIFLISLPEPKSAEQISLF